MTRRIAILSLILCISLFSFGQNRTLKLRFLDPSCDDSPIQGVRVKVNGSRHFSKYKTARNGWLVAKNLPETTFGLVVKKYGFKKYLIGDISLIGKSTTFEHIYKLERGYSSNDPNFGNPKYQPCKHKDKNWD